MVSLTSASREAVAIDTLRPFLNALTLQLLSLCKWGPQGGGMVKEACGRGEEGW